MQLRNFDCEFCCKLALCCFIKLLYDALCFLHNFDALCYLRNPTRRTPTTIDELPEEVIAEILVRLPPHPTCLLTESGTKQAWRQCMGSNYFRKLTLSHNRGNPLLGFFTNNSEDNRFISEHDLDPAILQTLTLPLDNSSSKSCLRMPRWYGANSFFSITQRAYNSLGSSQGSCHRDTTSTNLAE